MCGLRDMHDTACGHMHADRRATHVTIFRFPSGGRLNVPHIGSGTAWHGTVPHIAAFTLGALRCTMDCTATRQIRCERKVTVLAY